MEPGKVVTNSIGMKLVLIPAGEFVMGSPNAEQGREEDEGPQHRVRITRPFYLGQYEVTLAQFLQFRQDARYKCDAETNGGFGYAGKKDGKLPFELSKKYVPWNTGFAVQTQRHPVVNVSWNDATKFCEWLSRKEGKTYRLPSEAQWEYACRAGTTTPFSNNVEAVEQFANSADQALKREAPYFDWASDGNDGYPFTAPVGSFPPNAFGLYDMHGNAWEWCRDWFDNQYYSQSPPDDPLGPASGTNRAIRGGSWGGDPLSLRSAVRRDGPNHCDFTVGFRVVLESW